MPPCPPGLKGRGNESSYRQATTACGGVGCIEREVYSGKQRNFAEA